MWSINDVVVVAVVQFSLSKPYFDTLLMLLLLLLLHCKHARVREHVDMWIWYTWCVCMLTNVSNVQPPSPPTPVICMRQDIAYLSVPVFVVLCIDIRRFCSHLPTPNLCIVDISSARVSLYNWPTISNACIVEILSGRVRASERASERASGKPANARN